MELVENLLFSYQQLGFNVSVKMNFLLSHLDCLFRRTVGYWAMSTASIFIVISLQRTRDTTECAVYRYWQTVAWQFQEILLDLCTNDRWRDGAVTQDKL